MSTEPRTQDHPDEPTTEAPFPRLADLTNSEAAAMLVESLRRQGWGFGTAAEALAGFDALRAQISTQADEITKLREQNAGLRADLEGALDVVPQLRAAQRARDTALSALTEAQRDLDFAQNRLEHIYACLAVDEQASTGEIIQEIQSLARGRKAAMEREAKVRQDRIAAERSLSDLREAVGKIADDIEATIRSAERLWRLGDDDPPMWREHIRTRTVLLDRLRAALDQPPAAPALPIGLECPGEYLAVRLPDGGWRASGEGCHAHRDMPAARVVATAADGCGAYLSAPERDDCEGDPSEWGCTNHVSGWHVAVGAAVMAVWRLADGGSPPTTTGGKTA